MLSRFSSWSSVALAVPLISRPIRKEWKRGSWKLTRWLGYSRYPTRQWLIGYRHLNLENFYWAIAITNPVPTQWSRFSLWSTSTGRASLHWTISRSSWSKWSTQKTSRQLKFWMSARNYSSWLTQTKSRRWITGASTSSEQPRSSRSSAPSFSNSSSN